MERENITVSGLLAAEMLSRSYFPPKAGTAGILVDAGRAIF